MSDFSYKFGAVLGTQNDRPYYQATVPMRTLASLLKLDDNHDVNQRSQRIVDTARAKKFAKYLVDNSKNGFFVVPPVVGYIEGDYKFEEVPLDGFGSSGRMVVDLDAKFMLFDGQHRAYGIREAMAMCPELGHQSVSIMFFSGLSLTERQQAFHDINFTQKTPAAALCIAYNDRSEFDKMVNDTFSSSHIRGLVEYEKNTVSGNSDKIYSLKPLKDFCTNFLQSKEVEPTQVKLLNEYVTGLFETINIPAQLITFEAKQVPYERQRGVSVAKAYREDYIVGHAVTIKALAMLGRDVMNSNPTNWKEKIAPLSDLSVFNRSIDDWQGRCVTDREKMMSNQLAVRLTYYKLKQICGLALSPVERQEEHKYFDKDAVVALREVPLN